MTGARSTIHFVTMLACSARSAEAAWLLWTDLAVSHISAAIPTTGFRKLSTGASQMAPAARILMETSSWTHS
ncbi:hypothetical protein FB451DRAFT_1206518 [Mycena latifolia]|nr:hypothetical protein FB451DRAFT_1206518 [Mycena latifolia]